MKRKLLFLSVLLVSQFVAIRSEAQVIQFADANVKALCVANWDTNGDGELSKGEASAVTSLSRVFERNESIASFDELEYFTGLTTIENAVFEYCSGLTSVTIPNSVTSIGSFAFQCCSSLASVTIPNNVTSIGKRAFYNCSGLTSVSIGNGVTTVGEGAFYKCSGLTAVHITDLAAWCSISNNAGYNALYYAQHLFLNGVEITNLVIPDGVASIGFYAFEGCKNITSVTIPNSVRSIGGQAFYGCDAIESVVSMIETPFEMYNVNFSLSVYSNALLTVPAGTKAKYQATDGWKEFANIVEAGGQELSIEETRAIFMEELEKIYTNDYLPVKNTLEQEAKWTEMNTAYSDVSQKLNQLETKLAQSDLTDAQKAVITEKIDAVRATFQQAVSGMDRYALSDNQLKMVYNRILDVNAAAMNATTVEELTQLNNSLDQLKAMTAQALNMIAGAMQQMPPATILGQFETLKAQIESISGEIDQAFQNNIIFADANVKAICVANWDTNGDGELSMDEAAVVSSLGEVFMGNKSIVSFNELDFFTGLVSVDDRAFMSCSKLISATIPNNITTIGANAFRECSSLTSINIPTNTTYIGGYAFEGCSSLNSIVIPGSVIFLGHGVLLNTGWYNNQSDGLLYLDKCLLGYKGNKPSGEVEIADGTRLMAEYALSYCNGITSVIIPNSISSISIGAFIHCDALTSVTIPSSVTSIGYFAFQSCKGLTSVTIPNSVTVIEHSVFLGCSSLTSVTIPSSVESIGVRAFEDCFSLNSIESLIEEPFAIGDNVFSTFATAKLTVPAGTKTKYQATDGWKNFTKIVEAGQEDLFAKMKANLKEELAALYRNDYLSAKNILEQEAKWTEMNAGYTTISQKLNQLETKLVQSDLSEAQKAVIAEKIDAVRATFQQAASVMDKYVMAENMLKTVLNRIQEADVAAIDATTVEQLISLFDVLDQLKALTAQALNLIAGTMQETPPAIILGQFETLKTQIEAISDEIDLQPKDLSDATLTLTQEIFIYTGDYIKPACTLTLNSQELVTGTDYTIEYRNNIIAGQATVTIWGIGNYTGTVTATFTISKAPLTIKVENCTRKQGEENPEFVLTYEGFKNGETAEVLTQQPTATTEAVASSEPGKYAITISGAEAQNYEISYVMGELTVTEADPVTLTAMSYTREYGDENPAFGFTSEGAAVNGEPTIDCEATSASPVGTYDIVIKKGGVKNYNDTYVNGTLTITKAPLKVTVKDATKEQGEENPQFEISYEGWKLHDSESVLLKKPVATTTATKESPAGEYVITVSGGEAENYALSYADGTLTVTVPSSIGDLVKAGEAFDVYDMSGRKVRRHATMLNDLPKGVYIVGGRKQVVR